MFEQQDMSTMEVFTRREVQAATIWLHGLGVNASDLNAVIKNLSQSREMGLHYLAPNAPMRRISVDEERPARAWFDVLSQPGEAPEDCDGIEESARFLVDILQREAERGIPSGKTVLAGFSQGASMALHVGLRHEQPLAGIIALSGELVLADELPEAASSANGNTPILMMHGQDDEVVPVEAARRSRDHLLALGYSVEWQEYPVGHSLSPEQIERIDQWMMDVLSAD